MSKQNLTGKRTEPPRNPSDDDDALACVLRVLGPDEVRNDEFVTLTEALPPLTSSNEVDLQLYVFIAIIIENNILPWYGNITADRAFVTDVVHIIAHCSRALEQRFREVALAELLLEGIAGLLESHIKAWRIAHQAAGNAKDVHKIHTIYHALRPHPALQPVPDLKQPQTIVQQQRNDTDYRRLVAEGLLAVLLPIEDLQNPCLFALVSEIFSDLILGTLLATRLSDGVFVYDNITRAAKYAQQGTGNTSWIKDPTDAEKHRLETYGLLSSEENTKSQETNWRKSASEAFWATAQLIYVFAVGLRALMVLLTSTSLQPRSFYEQSQSHVSLDAEKKKYQRGGPRSIHQHARPILGLRIWQALASLLWIDVRMPWICAVATSVQRFALEGPGRVGGWDGRTDR